MRSLEQIRSQSFPVQKIDDWKEKAESSLKGRKIESIQSSTYENIVLKPLYTREDEVTVSEYPSGSDFRRGVFPLGYKTNEWKVAQRIPYKTPEELKAKLSEALEKGQTAISFEVTKDVIDYAADFINVNYPFSVNSKWLHHELLEVLTNQPSGNIEGYIANDPISLFAEAGAISEEYLQLWQNDILKANEKFPNVKTVLIDTAPYHNGGANAVQELGIAAATGVFYLEQLTEAGMGFEKVLSKMIFHFSIGSNFFMELAKLRAARIIWNRITELYGAKEEARGMQISAAASSFTKTVHDPHVNLLRAANEAFAAVLGGIQYLHVDPFDHITGSNSFSERIARNIQLILKEEAHLRHVTDPAGGSWYIESLTIELADKGWEFFQQIEANGGMLEVLKYNWLQPKINAVYEQRNMDIQTRKQSIVGTNVFAKLDEIPALKINSTEPELMIEKTSKIAPIPKRRLAEPFEELRANAKQLGERTGAAPSVALLCLGELKQYKARLDFMKGFLAAGGFNAVDSGPLFSLEDAKEYIAHLNTNFVCLCGANDQYESIGLNLLSALKTEFPNHTFFLVGLPEREKQDQWLNKGINQFIHAKSNCHEILFSILAEMEAAADEKQKA